MTKLSSVTKTESITADIHEDDTLPPLVSVEVVTMTNNPPAIPDHYLPGIPQLSSLPVSFTHVRIHEVVGEFQVSPVQIIADQTYPAPDSQSINFLSHFSFFIPCKKIRYKIKQPTTCTSVICF